MNGLTLRISSTGKNKVKTKTTFDPVMIPQEITIELSQKHDLFKTFMTSSAEEQLKILREMPHVSVNKNNIKEHDIMEFLAIVYLYAESKHPVQCYVIRYISKNEGLLEPFSASLINLIKQLISKEHNDYSCYKVSISQLASCIDNIPGTVAFKALKALLGEYLRDCLNCCTTTLSDCLSLSPTDRNEIYSLVHTTFRILLNVMQKLDIENKVSMVLLIEKIQLLIQQVLYCEDAPMDTKSVGGILYVTLYIAINGPQSWKHILNPENNVDLQDILQSEFVKLSLLSGIATVIPTQKLYSETVDKEPAMLTLATHILNIAERMSSDPVFLLAVTRILTHISKSLEQGGSSGKPLVNLLLSFVWTHMEHYMDSVGHLCAQALNHLVKYCARLHQQGDELLLDELFLVISNLDQTRKSFFLCVAALSREFGAQSLMERIPGIIQINIAALSSQSVQASATASLESLLQKHVRETSRAVIHATWVETIIGYITSNSLDSTVLHVLENLLILAIQLDSDLIDYLMVQIRQVCSSQSLKADNLKCALIMLSVARKCGALNENLGNEDLWKSIISCDLLKQAAIEALEENRILSISLIVESPKSTEAFTAWELEFVLWFLRYNVNVQSPSFRQTVLSMLKKFINRFDDSYKVLKRQNVDTRYYITFYESLREQCFQNLIPAANYSRRGIALQTLLWTENILRDCPRKWKEEHVEKLLLHLEDSYETNKALSLELLLQSPDELLQAKKYAVSLDFDDILDQASSVKPSDCVSAAYKLDLLLKKVPDNIPDAPHCPMRQGVRYRAVRATVARARAQLAQLQRNLLSAARDAPLHGVLHCLRKLLRLKPIAISAYQQWSALVEEITVLCVEVSAAVACVVNSASPEGHLPMDMTTVATSGSAGNVKLEDGRHVTAQMVLLCAWRSVKEVSLILGYLSGTACVSGENPGTLTVERVRQIGEHFTTLLTEVKHRGAFEQAYVGFTMMLAGLWKHHVQELRDLPKIWLEELMDNIESETDERLCATRRSAGLPFMIQALVTTELQAGGGRCFHSCVARLLHSARCGAPQTRTHCINIVRALFRCASLRDHMPPYAPQALLLALHGFRAPSWTERNSSTLLLSALMVWIFGVQRSRDSENLCTRNRMTGRIFFLRYPQLYDFMMNYLEKASENKEELLLSPALYPVFLLLARLYPSALEGTVSNFKVSSFVPLVRRCGRSPVLHTRRLAARALAPLLTPATYLPTMQDMLQTICDCRIPTNYCHGILLQLLKLMETKPDQLLIEADTRSQLSEAVRRSGWIMRQAAGSAPCYLLADEYMKMINLLIWKFPNILEIEFIEEVHRLTYQLLLEKELHRYQPGVQLFLANAVYLHLIISRAYCKVGEEETFIHECLSHSIYEVNLAILNYLLIVDGRLDSENNFHEHLKELCERTNIKINLQETVYEDMSQILKTSKYLECQQKALEVLTIKDGTQGYVIRGKSETTAEETEGVVIDNLIRYIEQEHESFTHHYLRSLCNYVSKEIDSNSIDIEKLLEAVRIIFVCSSSANSDETRSVVVEFLERNFNTLLKFELKHLCDEEKFELKATLFATLVVMLEDDGHCMRQRTSDIITSLPAAALPAAVPSRSADVLRSYIAELEENVAVLTILALLDFRSVVRMTDDINNECRVFDQNEKYNVFMEETIWTRSCVDTIKTLHHTRSTDLVELVRSVTLEPAYRPTFEKLCGDNLTLWYKTTGATGLVDDVNPKLYVFVNELSK